ncbi:MAG: putative rane protein [Myxococcaceae bacterium]|nr:putative rane protein [Myxococcaceae bacterium]
MHAAGRAARGTTRATTVDVKLKDKVQHALDEARMLILGIQVLLGFDLQAFFMSRWDVLPGSAHVVKLVSLSLLLVALVLVLAPCARHRIVDDGNDTPRLHGFTRAVTTIALLPFAVAMGLDFYVVGLSVSGVALGVALAATTVLVTVAAWFALPWALRKHRGSRDTEASKHSEDAMEKTDLNDKIRHVLTEARVVLPGTQALLGFQFAGVLQSGFDALPTSSKLVHVAVLVLLGASVVFLMLPAAYHRIAEDGEISERLHRFSSPCILLAMATLGFAVAGDTFIVVRKATGSFAAALGISGVWLSLAMTTWFVMMFVLRKRYRAESSAASAGPGRQPQHAAA